MKHHSQGEQLKNLIRGGGLTIEEAAVKLGMTRQNLSLYFHRDKLPYDFLQNVKSKLKLEIPVEQQQGIPVYDIDVTAGNMEFATDFPELIKGYINLPSFKDCVAFVNIKGDSMSPKFIPGDIVGVIPVTDSEIIQFGQTYLIITTDNQRLVKFLRKGKDPEHFILKSANTHYDDMDLKKENIVKLFRVKGPIRDDWQ